MNCSSTTARVVHGGVRRSWQGSRVVAALFVTVGSIAGATTAELDDAASRMQYAFYTGDARTIEAMLTLIEGFDVDPGLAAAKSYQLAYGSWKLAQLYADPAEERPRSNAKSLAAKTARACVQHARVVIRQDDSAAEAYAIEAVCDGFSPSSGRSACARSGSLRTALSLAPDNPRVQLIRSLCSGAVADPGALDRWRAVVMAFESAPPSRSAASDWGQVEALTLLGESYLLRGDAVAARDVLERALVLAPDYRRAQKLLQGAAARP